MQMQKRSLILQQTELMNHHRTRFTLQSDAGTGIFVQRFAIALECGLHGRQLLDVAAKALQHG